MADQKDGRSTDTRERILREAAKLYYSGNYESVSMQTIAVRLDISKAAIFHHFKSKQELFFEMWLMNVARFQKKLQETITRQKNQPIRVKLHGIIHCFVNDLGVNIPRLAQDVKSFLSPKQEEELKQFWHFILTSVQHVLEEGVARRELRPHHTKITSQILLNLGMLLLQPGNMQIFDPALSQDEYIDELLDIILNGLCID